MNKVDEDEIRRFRKDGWIVTHVTVDSSGNNLPYNGVLHLEKCYE